MDVDRPNSALLTWVPAPNSQTSTRSIFVVERQEVGSQEWLKCFTSETATSAELTGDSVQCEGNYRFRVCCINKYGRSGHVEFPKVVHLGEEFMGCMLRVKSNLPGTFDCCLLQHSLLIPVFPFSTWAKNSNSPQRLRSCRRGRCSLLHWTVCNYGWNLVFEQRSTAERWAIFNTAWPN